MLKNAIGIAFRPYGANSFDGKPAGMIGCSIGFSETAIMLMPALFIGHGSPMNTLESNRYSRAWRAIGAALPRAMSNSSTAW